MPPILTIKGLNGELKIYDCKVKICRKGLRNLIFHGLRGNKEIFFDCISSIQIRKGCFINNGYLHFTSTFVKHDTPFKKADDGDTILFSKKDNDAFEEAKDLIDELILKLKS